MFCSQCGAQQRTSANFCEDCGTPSHHHTVGQLAAVEWHVQSSAREAGAVADGVGCRHLPLSALALSVTMMGGCAIIGVLCKVATSDSIIYPGQQLPLLLLAAVLGLGVVILCIWHLGQ